MPGEPKEEVKETPIENVQLEKETPVIVEDTTKTDITEEVKKVEVEETELEKLKKKAADFDGLVEKQRLAKLNKSETPKTDDAILKQLEENNARLANLEKEKADNALTEAYKEFTTEMPWANSDEYFNKISDSFSSEGLTKKEEYVSKLRALAIANFPEKFAAYEEQKIKSKVLADATNITNGGGSGASSNVINNSSNKPKTEQELMQERLGSLLRKNITWLPKK